MDGGTLAAKRLSVWDPLVHGAIFRHDWGPTQDGEAGHWWLVSPVCDTARLSGEFTVTEHEDGTISVYPSLVFDRPGQSGLHGYLDRSVWSWGSFDDRRYEGVTDEQRAAVYEEPPGEVVSPGADMTYVVTFTPRREAYPDQWLIRRLEVEAESERAALTRAQEKLLYELNRNPSNYKATVMLPDGLDPSTFVLSSISSSH